MENVTEDRRRREPPTSDEDWVEDRYVRVSMMTMDSLDGVQRAVRQQAAPAAQSKPGYASDAAVRTARLAAHDDYVRRTADAWRGASATEHSPGTASADALADAAGARQRSEARMRNAWKAESSAEKGGTS